MPSYVDFLKKHGVTSPQGNYSIPYDYNPDLTRKANSPRWVNSTDHNPSEATMLCDSKALPSTHLRIIQKNCEIIPLIDENGNLIEKNYTPNFANKRNLIIFETEIYNKMNKSFLGICFLNDLLLKYAKKCFTIYFEEIISQKRYIVLEKTVNNKIIRGFFPIDTRFSKNYQRKVRKRMNWLIFRYGNNNAVNLTLTIDPKEFNNDKFKMWIEIKKELNRFLTALKYYFKKRKIGFPPYICTIEAQENGNPHLHFVFLSCKRLLDWRKIKKLWGLGHIFINRTPEGIKIRHPLNYITKYITKTFTKTNNENLLTQSLCWLFHIRSFSTSKKLIIPIKPVGTGEWKPIFLIIGNKFFELSDIRKIFCIDTDLTHELKDHWIEEVLL